MREIGGDRGDRDVVGGSRRAQNELAGWQCSTRCDLGGRVDAQNRLWFAEFGANAIGLFDPKTAEIKEIPLPTKYTLPYDVATNKDASEVWTGSMLNDLVVRLNTKTGTFTEYLLPRSTNIRRVYVQDVGPNKTAFWAGSNHGASIVKVEPLD